MFEALKKKISGLTDQTREQKEVILKYGLPLFAILILINTIQIARFGHTVASIDRYKEGLVDELGGFRQDITRFGSDINEIRNYLLLPTKDYSFVEEEIDTGADEQVMATDTEKALYAYIAALVNEQKVIENTQKALTDMSALQKDFELRNALKQQSLYIGFLKQEEGNISFEIYRGKEKYYEVLADPKQGSIKLTDICEGSVNLQGSTLEMQRQEIIEYIKANTEKIQSALLSREANRTLVESTMNEAEIKELIAEKKLMYLPQVQEGRFEILNGDNVALLSIVIMPKDGSITINGEALPATDNLKAMLISAISQLDGTTQADILVAQRRKELEGVIKEEAFADLLKEVGYKIATEPREEYNKLLYDVTDNEGNVQFSFSIELSSGLIKILRGNQEVDLFSAIEETGKKKL